MPRLHWHMHDLPAAGAVLSRTTQSGPGQWLATAFVGLWLLTACAAAPPPATAPGAAPALASDEAGLRMQMQRAEQQIATAGNRVRDPALEAYVRDVACRVAGAYCPEIRVYLLQVPDFNASMAPNGTLVVWTGLLLRASNEAELAGVLGHEVAHYRLRHSLARLQKTESALNVLTAVQLATLFGGVPLAGDLSTLAAQGYLAGFSRDQERAADDVGLRALQEAGYQPKAMASIWDGMLAEIDAAKEPQPPAFFATHPPTPQRAAGLAAMGAVLENPNTRNETAPDRYLAHTQAHRADWLRDELAQRRYPRTEVLLKRLATTGVRPGEVAFFQGELYRLRNQSGDDALAIAAYQRALGGAGAPPETARQLGLALRGAHREAEARVAFARYLRDTPTASDRVMIESYLAPAP